MFLPLVHINDREIKGEGGIVLKKSACIFIENPERKNSLNNFYKNKEKLFLTDYRVYKSTKLIGSIHLNQYLTEFGGSLLTYSFQERVSAQDVVDVFKTFLSYIHRFYGWKMDSAIEEMRSEDIFQEVSIKLSGDDSHLEPLLKAGFKISFVGESDYILRHRFQDHTGLGYEEIKKKLGEGDNISFSIDQKHYSKIEKTILGRGLIQGADIEAFRFYLRKNQDALGYYLFLLGENATIYLDYARIMTVLKVVDL